MQVKAPISSNYRWRILGVGAMCLGFALWFLYDGFVGYPQATERYAVFYGLNPANVAPAAQDDQMERWKFMADRKGWPEERPTDTSSEAYLYYNGIFDRNANEEVKKNQILRWEAEAIKRGWSPEEPTSGDNKSRTDILAQKILGFLCLPFGLWFAYQWIASGGRWIGLDGDTLITSSGQRVDAGQIKEIDAARWKAKGIAWVHYEDDKGEQRILIDDWKYERKPTVQIYNAIAGETEEDAEADDASSAKSTDAHSTDHLANESEETSPTNTA